MQLRMRLAFVEAHFLPGSERQDTVPLERASRGPQQLHRPEERCCST
jgi:hypothetical protein